VSWIRDPAIPQLLGLFITFLSPSSKLPSIHWMMNSRVEIFTFSNFLNTTGFVVECYSPVLDSNPDHSFIVVKKSRNSSLKSKKSSSNSLFQLCLSSFARYFIAWSRWEPKLNQLSGFLWGKSVFLVKKFYGAHCRAPLNSLTIFTIPHCLKIELASSLCSLFLVSSLHLLVKNEGSQIKLYFKTIVMII
jgi:hypothetical protein